MGILLPEQKALLTDHDAASSYRIAYHNVYTTICANWNKEKNKQLAILLTTPAVYAGQAIATANLAIAAAQDGTPTVLIDADLHAPSLHQCFGITPPRGLSTLLAQESISEAQLGEYLNKTFVPDLSLLAAGSAEPPRAASSRFLANRLGNVITSFRNLLDKTEERPCLIIFHSSPVLSDIDASIISTHVDQTFLTIAAGHTTRTQAKRAEAQLERVHARLAGVIMLDL